MKFNELRAIGHNIADSLADGSGLLIGTYDMRVFEEARGSNEGFIEVDFMTGTSSGGQPSASLARAFVLYREALPAFCEKHGISSTVFRRLSACFFADRRFAVTIEDFQGRSATDVYVGTPGKLIKVLDPRGRVRRKRGPLIRVSE